MVPLEVVLERVPQRRRQQNEDLPVLHLQRQKLQQQSWMDGGGFLKKGGDVDDDERRFWISNGWTTILNFGLWNVVGESANGDDEKVSDG